MRLHFLAGLLLLSGAFCWANEENEFQGSEGQCPEKQTGDQNRFCKLHEQFKGKDHHCVEIEKVQCPEGAFVAEGSVCEYSPQEVIFTCKSGNWSVQDKATRENKIIKSRGWRVRIRVRWRRKRVVYVPKYVTNKPPVIDGCPSGTIQETAQKSKTTAIATWQTPTATDPEGQTVTLELIYGKNPGSEFPAGETVQIYRARDAGGASEYCWFVVNVEVLRCHQKPRYIPHGTYSCSDPNNEDLYGSVCTYSCDSGYEISGPSATMECQQTQQWDFAMPTCAPISCGTPGAVVNGGLSCPNGYVFPELCYVVCSPGFHQLSGVPFVRCTENKVWTSTQDCVDVEAPVFVHGCPAGRSVFTGPLEAPVPITWTDPLVFDSSNYTLSSSLANGSMMGPGIQIVRITARDTVGNYKSCDFVVTVEARTCSYPQLSSNSRLNCTHGYIEGSRCTVTCDTGYTLQGNSTMTCLDTETWDSPAPTCEAVDCGPPPTVEFGTFSVTSFRYPAVNSLVCDTDFDLQGAAYSSCQENGAWSTPGKCVDNTPPTFPSGCPANVEVYASRLGQPTVAHWTPPPVDDNSGRNVTLHSSPAPGSAFWPGVTSVTYTATDYRGNSRSCTFSVTLTTLTCASLTQNNTASLRYTCPDKNVYGATCTSYCTNGFPKVGADNMTCEMLSNTTYPPTMDWQWDQNSSQPACIAPPPRRLSEEQCRGCLARCQHTVTGWDRESKCLDITPPRFGALACYQGNFAKECVQTCEASRDIPSSFDGFFSCSNTLGVWNPPSAPDCIAYQLPGSKRMLLHAYYYTGSCPAAMDAIKQQFITIVNGFWQSACSSTPSCIASNIKVTCGATRRKKSTSSDLGSCLRQYQGNLGLCLYMRKQRQKRSAMSHYIKGSFTLDISNCDNGATRPDDALTKCKAVMNNIYTLFGDEAANGGLNIGTQYTTDRHFMSYPEFSAECEPGTLFMNTARSTRLTCVGCFKGNFLAINSTQCQQCPVGTYTELDNATDCTDCPPGWSTPTTGSTSSSDCQELCQPGHYSEDGFVPCQPCPPGQFQANARATSCDLCPASTWTSGAATGLEQCLSADAHLSNNTRLLAQSSNAVSSLTLILHVFLADVAVSNVTFTFVGSSYDPVSVFLYTHSNLTSFVPPDSSTSVSRQAVPNAWMGLVLNADPSSGQINVALDSASIFTRSTTPTASMPPADVTVTVTEGKVLVGGLYGEEGVNNITTPSSTSNDCNGNSSTNLLTWTLPVTSLQFPSTCDAVDECQSSPCSTHGVCINQQGGYLCQCHDGWHGPTCHQPPDACYQHQCQNGATCLPQGSNFTCVCAGNFSGTLCELTKVHGGFNDWSIWANCSSACNGEQRRFRYCINPPPQNNGDNCTGDYEQKQSCGSTSCPVDGGWSVWTPWSACSASCGAGTVRTRQRVCDNPAPQFGGDRCEGLSEETDACVTNKCAVDGLWSLWTAWSQCSSSCGGGFRSRQRACDSPAPQFGGNLCTGTAMEGATCNTHACPVCSTLSPSYTIVLSCDDTVYPKPDPVTCNIACAPGMDTSRTFPQLKCGPSTGYLWNDQIDNTSAVILPECSVPTTAAAVSLSQCVPLQAGCDVDTNAYLSGVRYNIAQLPCVGSGCQISTSTTCSSGCSGNWGRSKRVAGSLILNTVMTMALGNGSTALNTSDPSQQYVQLYTLADQTAALLLQNQTSGASPFTVSLNGVLIQPDLSSMVYSPSMQCPAGSTSVSYYCVGCPKGSMETSGQCILCPVGQYQDQPGSTTCKSCPAGYTWDLPGATDIIQCAFSAQASASSPSAADNGDNLGLIVGLAVGGLVVAGITAAVAVYFIYQNQKAADKIFHRVRPLSAMSAKVHPEPHSAFERSITLTDMTFKGGFKTPLPHGHHALPPTGTTWT